MQYVAFSVVRNSGYALDIQIYDSDGTLLASPTSYTYKLRMAKDFDSLTAVQLTGAVTDEANSIVTFTFAATDTHDLEVRSYAFQVWVIPAAADAWPAVTGYCAVTDGLEELVVV